MPSNSQDYYAPSAVSQTNGEAVLIITDNQVHDLEFFYPLYRLTEEGYRVDVATPQGGDVTGKFGMKLSNTMTLEDVQPSDYAMLYIPGGKAPSTLRTYSRALDLTREFAKQGKPVAAICHGAQVLVRADLAKGKRLAAWPEVEPEIREAGGMFVDEPCVTDGQLITARWPGDLPAHLSKVLKALGSGQRGMQRQDGQNMKAENQNQKNYEEMNQPPKASSGKR